MSFYDGDWGFNNMPSSGLSQNGAGSNSGVTTISLSLNNSLVSNLTQFASSVAISYALSYVAGLLNKPKDNAQDNASSVAQLTDRLHVIRSAVAPRNQVYGEVLVSGPLVFVASQGTNNSTLHVVIVLASHEVNSITDIYLGDDLLGTLDPVTGVCNSGKYINNVKVRKHLGVAGDAADADLVAANVGWTVNHTLSGCAYLYLKLTYVASVFTNGVPNIKALVKGRKLFDPRTGLTKWTDNWALCCRDFVSGVYGMNALASEIDDEGFKKAADISEQQVAISTFSMGVITVAAQNTFKSVSLPTDYKLTTGDRISFTTDGTLPTGVSLGVDYFVSSTPSVGGNFYFSTTLAQAVAGANVSITGTGTGSHKAHVSCGQYFTLTAGNVKGLAFVSPVTTPLPAEAAIDIRTGDVVRYSTLGIVTSTGLVNGNNYYAIRITRTDIALASSLQNALDGISITHGIVIGSGGKIRISQVSQRRYTCNGTVSATQTPREVLQDLLSCGVGTLTYIGGIWNILAGGWRTPSGRVLCEDDLRAEFTVNTRVSRRELFNAVRGTYADPTNAWQPTDFPAIRNDIYKSQDGGEEIWNDVKLNFTTNSQEAQRIAKVHLEASRQGMTVTFPAKYTAFGYSVGDIVPVCIDSLGWVAKYFQVMDWELANGGGVNLSLREVASTIWDWNYGDATHVDPAPDSMLPDPAYITPPSAPEVVESLFVTTGSAGVKARAIMTWVASDDNFVVDYLPEYRIVSGSWIVLPSTVGLGIEINDISPGTYEFRLRARNAFGIASTYSESIIREMLGLTSAPEDVTGFTVIKSGGFAKASWSLHPAIDVRIGGRMVIRHSPLTTSAEWTRGVILQDFNGDAVSGDVPLMTGTYMIKAMDSSGNYSVNTAVFVTTEGMLTGMVTVGNISFSPDFTGSKTNVGVLDGRLQLVSPEFIDSGENIDGSDDIDGGLISIFGQCDLSSVLDLTTSAIRRIQATIISNSFDVGDFIDGDDAIDSTEDIDGEAINDCDATLYCATTPDDPYGTPIWSPWQPFFVGDFEGRALKFRLVLTSGSPSHNIAVSALSVSAKITV